MTVEAAEQSTVLRQSRAWLSVASCFVALAVVLGVLYSFGDFVEPMTREFNEGRGATSLIFSGTTFLFLALGVLTGTLADRQGARLLGIAGAIAMGLGLYLASVAGGIVSVFVAYGLGVGIANGCIYVPMIAAVGRRFTRHRGLAVGIAVTGIGVGTLLMPPLAADLIGWLGWRGAFRALALPSTAILLACSFGIGDRGHHDGGRISLPLRALTGRTFVTLYVGTLLLSAAIWSGFVYLAPYAESLGVGPVSAAFLLSGIGVGGIVGRLLLASLTEWMPALTALRVAIIVSTLSFVFWLPFLPYVALFAFAVLVGAGQGGWIALIPPALGSMFGVATLGRSVGAYWTSGGIGALVGPTFAGFLIDTWGYPLAITCQLAIALAGCALFFVLPREGQPAESAG